MDHGKSTLADRMMEVTGAISAGDDNEQVLDSLNVERFGMREGGLCNVCRQKGGVHPPHTHTHYRRGMWDGTKAMQPG